MLHTNQMEVNTIRNATGVITINLAHDEKEVRGFGMPVECGVARKMIEDYITEYEKAAAFFLNQPVDKPESLKSLENLFSEQNHIVSGVFGKEIILQILAQKNCEGIRYVFARDKGKITLVLFGVNDRGTIRVGDEDVAQSGPLDDTIFSTGSIHNAGNTIIGEVHGSSKTVAELKAELHFNGDANTLDTLTNKILGIY